eukprot:2867117-Rhodomonas_salina.1
MWSSVIIIMVPQATPTKSATLFVDSASSTLRRQPSPRAPLAQHLTLQAFETHTGVQALPRDR